MSKSPPKKILAEDSTPWVNATIYEDGSVFIRCPTLDYSIGHVSLAGAVTAILECAGQVPKDNRAPSGAQERKLPGGGFFRDRDEGMVTLYGPDGAWLYTAPEHSWRAAIAPAHPQDERAALVEHLQARIRIAESAGVELARIRLDTLREIINALSAPAKATEPPSHTDLMVPPESVPDYSPSAHFGASLREARVAAGLSLRDAAALFGVTPERYGAVERGAVRRRGDGAPRAGEGL